MGDNIEPSLGGNFLSVLRDQADLVGFQPTGNRQHLVLAGAFEIEFHPHFFLQEFDIVILDMPPICPQVSRDLVRSPAFGHGSSRNRVWFDGFSGLPNRRDVINVDA
jgi:hypothetical protein